MLHDGFTVSRGCISVPLIIARPLGVSLFINNCKTSIKPIQGEKALLTLVVYMCIICGYQTSHHWAIWHKTLLGKRLPCLVDIVYQCIVVLSVICFIFWGTGCQCILLRLTEQKPMVTMGKQDLKKCWMCPHVSFMDNICDPFVMICAQWLWENHGRLWEPHSLLTINPEGAYVCIAIWG